MLTEQRDVWAFTFCGFGTSILSIFIAFGILHGSDWGMLAWPGGPLLGIVGILIFPPKTKDRPGFCATCGYDLRATRERCPECGTAVAGIREKAG